MYMMPGPLLPGRPLTEAEALRADMRSLEREVAGLHRYVQTLHRLVDALAKERAPVVPLDGC